MSETRTVAAEARCKARVFDRSGWARAHNCSNKATRDGFCGIHHPDAQAKRDQKSREKFERDAANSIYAKYAAMTADRDRLQAEVAEYRAALQDVIGWIPSGNWHTDAPKAAVTRARALLEARK